MKKRINIILLCGLLTSSVFCQSKVSYNQLYNRFAREKNVEKVNLSGLLMFMIKPLTAKYTGFNISGVSVMSLDECSHEVKLKFNELAGRFDDDKYELLMMANDKNEKVRIFGNIRNDIIRELVIVTMGDDPAIVRIKGKIKPEDIHKLMNNKR